MQVFEERKKERKRKSGKGSLSALIAQSLIEDACSGMQHFRFFQFLSRIGTKKDSTKFSWQIFPSSLSSFRLFFKGRRSSSKHETRTSHFVSPYSKLESCWSKSYTRLNLFLHPPPPLLPRICNEVSSSYQATMARNPRARNGCQGNE